ncbi:MAG: glycosyltransferase [Bellilinea sp.]
MGKVVKIGDPHSLAEALLEVLGNRPAYVRDAQPIRQRYLPDTIAEEYEKLFHEIQRELRKS